MPRLRTASLSSSEATTILPTMVFLKKMDRAMKITTARAMMMSRYKGSVMPRKATSTPTGSDSGIGEAPQIHLMTSTPISTTA